MARLRADCPLDLVRNIRHRERFLSGHPMLWVEDVATQLWTPLWLRHQQAWLVNWLQPGASPPAALTGALRGQMYTAGVLIDETRPANGEPWPLWFQTPEGREQVLQAVGDGVLFRGCELPHWRGAATPQHEQVNLLFHFVPVEWVGVMD